MYGIFVLGAGFSKPARLPLGNELFEKILEMQMPHEISYEIQKDLRSFMEYKQINQQEALDNYEDFISFLDIEHYLGLRGNDTYCDGNKSQIAIKNLIAKFLYRKMSLMDEKDYKLYEYFFDRLDPGDIIITFNYDTILEKCLEEKNKPYRLFPNRLSSNKRYNGVLDTKREEIVLLKMHGSIDWFDKKCYDEKCDIYKEYNYPRLPNHPVFNNNGILEPKKIIDGPYFPDSQLNMIYRINDLEKYFEMNNGFYDASLLILSPSSHKTLYMSSLKEFWYSFNDSGYLNQKVSIIGFSLPEHDEYIRQPLFNLIRQFQNHNHLHKPERLKIVDYQQTKEDIDKFKSNYSFVDWDKTDVYFDGFCKEAIDMIFEEE